MIKRHRLRYSQLLTVLRPRCSIVKLKINGVCVNKCRFCPFHSDPHRLEVEDLAYFFGMVRNHTFNWVVVNGGEPTIHPHFLDICGFLSGRFRGRIPLTLGTNLIPLSRSTEHFRRLYRTVLETFDRIEVGCDDEHRNIDILERLAPEIVAAGVILEVNTVTPYCSAQTMNRILAVGDRLGVNVTLSKVHHFYESQAKVNDLSVPCRKRVRNFLLNCNGDAFFCYHQEMEEPLFNLFSVGEEEMNYYLNEYMPGPYRFCACCPLYQRETWFDGLSARLTNIRTVQNRRAHPLPGPGDRDPSER